MIIDLENGVVVKMVYKMLTVTYKGKVLMKLDLEMVTET